MMCINTKLSRDVEDSDFIQQMVKAAAVAFGGGRPNDYPKAWPSVGAVC